MLCSVLRKEVEDGFHLGAQYLMTGEVAGMLNPPVSGEGEIRACIVAFEAGEVTGIVKREEVHCVASSRSIAWSSAFMILAWPFSQSLTWV